MLLLDVAMVVARVDEGCCRAGCFPAVVKDNGTKAGLNKIGDKIIGKEEKGKLWDIVAHQW